MKTSACRDGTLKTSTTNPHILPFGQQQSGGPNKSSGRIGGQESDSAHWEPERRLFQPYVCGSQGKGLMASSDQSKIPEYTYLVPHHCKMEGIRVMKSLIQKGAGW